MINWQESFFGHATPTEKAALARCREYLSPSLSQCYLAMAVRPLLSGEVQADEFITWCIAVHTLDISHVYTLCDAPKPLQLLGVFEKTPFTDVYFTHLTDEVKTGFSTIGIAAHPFPSVDFTGQSLAPELGLLWGFVNAQAQGLPEPVPYLLPGPEGLWQMVFGHEPQEAERARSQLALMYGEPCLVYELMALWRQREGTALKPYARFWFLIGEIEHCAGAVPGGLAEMIKAECMLLSRKNSQSFSELIKRSNRVTKAITKALPDVNGNINVLCKPAGLGR